MQQWCTRTKSLYRPRLGSFLVAVGLLALTSLASSQSNGDLSLDKKVMDEIKKNSQQMSNLTYLCDEIGPRMTGSANLKRASNWAADKMKEYGLTDVHQEPYTIPQGWERGSATARVIEPDTGRTISIASMAWTPGTKGKVTGDVVIIRGNTLRDLEKYKGKLKNAIVLSAPPTQLRPIEEIDKRPLFPTRTLPLEKGARPGPGGGGRQGAGRERADFLRKEGVACLMQDAGKHLGQLFTTGSWRGQELPSDSNRLPSVAVAHNHYEMLWRLASRTNAKTRMEIEINNKFIPGPIVVTNIVGDIRGKEKPDEVVVLGAHIDSWDLAQGATDNGTGTTAVLEAARALVKSGIQPRRTIRFILFSGEEQGLHGSAAYVTKHKDEMAKFSACIVHDTGTGKVTGLGAGSFPGVPAILEKELVSLRRLGVKEFTGRSTGGSDHASFARAGVPGMMCMQEVAGYPLSHHSQADTVDRAIAPNLIQGAQVLAVSAMRLANRDGLLPRTAPKEDPTRPGEEAKPITLGLDDLGKMVGVSEPQFSPDGKSIVFVVSRPNYDKNRSEKELVLFDLTTGKQKVLTQERPGVGHPRWSPNGESLAFLDWSGSGKDRKRQIYVLPMSGGEAKRLTSAAESVQHFSWRPDGEKIAYAVSDEPVNKKTVEKGDDAFEVGNTDFLAQSAPTPTHVWLIDATGGKANRLTSGKSGLTTVPPPGAPTSPLSWSEDGRSLLVVLQENPHDGDNDLTTIQVLDVESGKLRSLTGRTKLESCPIFSPDGSQVAYWYPKDGDPNNINQIWLTSAEGGKGLCLTEKLDRCLLHSTWSADGKTLLVGGHDGTKVALWVQPVSGEGKAQRLDLGRVCPSWSYSMDAVVSSTGTIAFTASEARRPTELYLVSGANGTPRRLTNFNEEVASRKLGRVDTITWEVKGGFQADGVLTFPPDFDKEKKYPLTLVIHGGPQSASVERFNPLAQLIAAKGHVVFEPNYRGSDHLGNDYMKAIVGDWGKGPGEDVMAGLEAVKKRGYVDEKRIAVTGWSYGGYMTTWLIGNYQGWRTAMAGAAVTDWSDQYHLSDGNVQGRYLFGGSPWKGDYERLFREQSPISYARNIKTPTLIMATTGDARVPITQSFRLYHALKDNGVPVKFVAYPVSGHFPGDPVRQKDLFKRWVSWVDEQMRDPSK